MNKPHCVISHLETYRKYLKC